ncbi:MAG: ribokinase [Firmicutes bacterium]|nr:ribokinase [Bacillota bacterium]
MCKILVAGSLCVDYYYPAGRDIPLIFPGGKGGNQAVAAKRLGADVWLFAVVGADEGGAFLLQHLKKEGISTDTVFQKPHLNTGYCLIRLSADGEGNIQGYPGANLHWGQAEWEKVLPLLKKADCLLLQLEIPLPFVWKLLHAAEALGKMVILNLGPPRRTELPQLGEKTFLVLNAQEAGFHTQIFPEDFASAKKAASILRKKAHHVVITLGSRGALLATEGDYWHLEAPKKEVVDTTGAGDAFCAALAVALLREETLQEAASFACRAAAEATTVLGTQGSTNL